MRTVLFSGLILSLAAVAKDPPKADLTLKDSTGQKVSLRDLRGKNVVLNFWATWCVPCNDEMPMIVEMEKEYRARGVVFIAASLDDSKTRSQIPAFVSKYQIGFPVWARARRVPRAASWRARPSSRSVRRAEVDTSSPASSISPWGTGISIRSGIL